MDLQKYLYINKKISEGQLIYHTHTFYLIMINKTDALHIPVFDTILEENCKLKSLIIF